MYIKWAVPNSLPNGCPGNTKQNKNIKKERDITRENLLKLKRK